MVLFRPVRAVFSLFVTVVSLYAFFFVPIGRRTLYEHLKRIEGTPEAQEVEREFGGAGLRVLEKARSEIQNSLPLPTHTWTVNPEADEDGGLRDSRR